MRRFLHVYADVSSVIFAIGIAVFFLGFGGYHPSGENGMLIGMAVVVLIAVTYVVIEALPVMQERTPDPVYFAIEAQISQLPAYAIVWVVAAWTYGATQISGFQWTALVIFAIAVLADVVGIVAVVARQLLLTDEMKHVR